LSMLGNLWFPTFQAIAHKRSIDWACFWCWWIHICYVFLIFLISLVCLMLKAKYYLFKRCLNARLTCSFLMPNFLFCLLETNRLFVFRQTGMNSHFLFL
jgi:hypothetical protein